MVRRPETMRLHVCLALVVIAWSLVPLSAPAADAPIVACSAETPTVEPGATVAVTAWAAAVPGQAVSYSWEAPVGRLEARGRQARWDLTGLRPGTYAAVARATGTAGGTGECVVRVIVRADTATRGTITPAPAPARETGSAFLVAGGRETDGYGLYSYLLLGAPPTADARERYLKAIETFSSLLPQITALEQYVPRAELNVAYLPVTGAPPASATAAWVLDNYDYARARSLLRYLPGPRRDGPYLVSTLKPLGGRGASASSEYLLQDLSNVPPHLAASWVKEFLNQAAQERFWDERSGVRLALKMRVTVAILGEGLPEVRKALDGWISWTR